MKSFFTPKEACALTGTTYRQLQHSDKTKLVQPSYRRRGKYRQYVFSDLLQLWLVRQLRARGWSIQRMHRVIRAVRQLFPRIDHPLADTVFVFGPHGPLLAAADVEMCASAAPDYLVLRAADLRAAIDAKYPDETGEPVAPQTTVSPASAGCEEVIPTT